MRLKPNEVGVLQRAASMASPLNGPQWKASVCLDQCRGFHQRDTSNPEQKAVPRRLLFMQQLDINIEHNLREGQSEMPDNLFHLH